MDQLEELRRRLKDRRLYIVAAATGLSYYGIRKILTGETKKPSRVTIAVLLEYLDATA